MSTVLGLGRKKHTFSPKHAHWKKQNESSTHTHTHTEVNLSTTFCGIAYIYTIMALHSGFFVCLVLLKQLMKMSIAKGNFYQKSSC